MLFGFDRIPLLLERVIYYKEELPRLDNSFQIASTYAVITSVIVTIAAVVYLKVSGAFDISKEEVM
jgi:multiple sugar transport system permease protein